MLICPYHEEEATSDEFRTIEPSTFFQTQKPAKKCRFNLFYEKLAMSTKKMSHVTKVSDCGAAVVIIPVLQRLGHDSK